LQDARLIAENLIWAGIRYLVPHGLFYSTHALKKHDAPPTFFFQMPYWPLFGQLSKRVTRLLDAFAGTWIDAHVLLIEPSAGQPTREQLTDFENLQHALVSAHVDFLACDRDILAEGEIRDGKLQIRDLTVDTIVVPAMADPEPELTAWLAAFPGTVLYRQNFANVAELVQTLPPVLPLGADTSRVFSVVRTDGKQRRVLLVNNGSSPVDLHLGPGFPLIETPLQDDLPSLLVRDGNGYRRELAAYESVLLVESQEPLAPVPPVVRLAFPLDCAVEPQTPNLVRLNRWELALTDEGESATVDAIPLANQLRQGGFRFAPEIREGFGQMPTLGLPTLQLRYTCGFEFAANSPVELVMEPGSLLGDWSLRLNESPAWTERDFQPTTTHVRGSLGLDLTPWLQPGPNRLVIELTTNRLDGGLRNPLYLAGGFGVQLAPLRLADRPMAGLFDAYEGNGLPHFSGVIDYTASIDLAGLPQDDRVLLELALPVPCEEALELSLNGNTLHPLPWSPRHVLVPAQELRTGANQVRLRVRTSLIRAFEGQCFDLERHAYDEL